MLREDEGGEQTEPSSVNPLQLINAVRAERSAPTGLMYVKLRLDGQEVLAMVDTGAMHNFVAERIVKTLGLRAAKSECRIKAVNSAAQNVVGVATGVQVNLGL